MSGREKGTFHVPPSSMVFVAHRRGLAVEVSCGFR